MIKLKGPLPENLKDLGLKPGNKFHGYQSVTGNPDDVEIRFLRDNQPCIATVTKKNYIKI